MSSGQCATSADVPQTQAILYECHQQSIIFTRYLAEAEFQGQDVIGHQSAGDNGGVHPLSKSECQVQQVEQKSCTMP